MFNINKPINLLIGGTTAIGLIVVILLFLLEKIFNIPTPHWIYLLSFILTWVITFFIFRFILEKFIYDKIKLIYKTIHTLKMPKKDKNKRLDLNEDLIGKITLDVSKWAYQHQKEIEELKKNEIYRREFLANVSHELKTPLFNLQGFVLTLLDGAINDPQVNKTYLEKAEKNINRMINLVKDLEIISQLESGQIVMNMTKFDIIALTREVFEMLELKANEKSITLKINEQIDHDEQIYVRADRERIRQVLHNLIENSIHYGNINGRTKVSFYYMNDLILTEVSDNGIGIEEQHLPRLFERFYRVDKSRSRNLGGSGLGLAIVKHIIEAHQQTIHVRSAVGVGTTFSFTLERA